MRVEYKELMERLGVGYILSAYETRPWFLYDADQKITCSAEVRIGPGISDVEAEIQFLYDEPVHPSGDPVEQVFMMRIMPMRDNLWTPKLLFIRGENYVNKVHDWEGRGCSLFCACIAAIQMGELPDLDELIEDEMSDDGTSGGRRKRGRIGKKAPSVKPAALLGMKQ